MGCVMDLRRYGSWVAAACLGFAGVNPLCAEPERLERVPQPWLETLIGFPEWVQFSMNYTSETNANPFGGDRQTGTYTHNLHLNSAISTGFTKQSRDWQEIDHWSLHLTASQRSGTSLSEKIPNQLAVQQIYGYGQTGRLAGLWLERQQLDDGLLKLKLGKFAAFDDFASSPLYCYYTNNGFCGQNWGIPTSLPVLAYPSNQYGLAVHLGDADGPQVRTGIFQINPDGADPGLHGTDFSILASDGVAQFVQLNVPFGDASPLPVKRLPNGSVVRVAAAEQDGLYVSGLPQAGVHLGGWLGFWDFPKVSAPDAVSRDNHGLYGLVSVPWRFGSVALDGRLWANATYGLRSGVQEVPNTYAAGWIGKGVIRTRPHDALVLGVTNANWNRRIQGGPIWETAMELGYQLALGSNATLQPSAQYIFNPMGRGEVDDALVLGLQLNVSF